MFYGALQAPLAFPARGPSVLYAQRLPKKIEHDNLVLERGLAVGSPLTLEFNAAMSLFKFKPSNVLVTLLDHTRIPIAGWRPARTRSATAATA